MTDETKTAKPIPLTPVTGSQLIAGLGFDAEAGTLAVKFAKDGRTYHFPGATQDDHDALASAESVGRHFLANIRPRLKGHAQPIETESADVRPQPAA